MKLFLLISAFLFLSASNIQNANKLYAKKKYKQAFNLYKKSDSIIAKNNIAMMYYYGQGVTPDQAKAVGLLESLLKKNLSNKDKRVILYNLGMMYYHGYINNFTHKLIVDRHKAKKLLKESSELGYLPAKKFYNNIYKNNKEINATKSK